MILNQTPLSTSSSFHLEVKCLLFTLVIIFLINTPMRFIKADKQADFSMQLSTLQDTLLLKRSTADSLLALADTQIAIDYFSEPQQFNDVSKQLLSTQTLVKSLKIISTQPDDTRYARLIEQYNRYYTSDLNKQQIQLFIAPHSRLLTEFKALYQGTRHIGYLVLEADLSEFSEVSRKDILLLGEDGTVYSSTDRSLKALDSIATKYPQAWRDLQLSNRNAGIMEYDDVSFIYRKFKLVSNHTSYLIKVVDNHELVPPYFYLVLLLGSITAGVSLYLYRLRKDKLELTKITYTDELSGLHNRHYLKKVSAQLTAQQGYYACILDIDHFKAVNDKYGHDIGDQVIKRVSSVIKSRIRITDYAFRFGGEEFVVVVKTESAQQAVNIFERIGDDVARFIQKPNVTISGGVWPVNDSLDEALKQADVLLYQAKQNGRNLIISQAA